MNESYHLLNFSVAATESFGMWRHAIRTGNYFAIPLELRIKV